MYIYICIYVSIYMYIHMFICMYMFVPLFPIIHHQKSTKGRVFITFQIIFLRFSSRILINFFKVPT